MLFGKQYERAVGRQPGQQQAFFLLGPGTSAGVWRLARFVEALHVDRPTVVEPFCQAGGIRVRAKGPVAALLQRHALRVLSRLLVRRKL
jgi:hypothetical protein